VADRLRDRVLNGDIADGGMLAKQDDLAAEFGVTKAAVREACRILEAEGLLRVIRGNVGGSVVHVPTPGTAAYTLGMVLQARGVLMPDVGVAVGRLEPLVAQLCAERADRAAVVLPALEAAQAALSAALDAGNGDAASVAARRWHESLVEHCGNDTIAVLIGTLEALWSAHARDAAVAAHARGLGLDVAVSRRVYAEHEAIQDLIRAGDGPATAAAAGAHLETARIHPAGLDDAGALRSSAIRDQLLR
jgi:DNA-binding FadR family transcriptional regulator